MFQVRLEGRTLISTVGMLAFTDMSLEIHNGVPNAFKVNNYKTKLTLN